MVDSVRKRARELASEAVAKGRPTQWFEQLYREAQAGEAVVPWDDREANPLLIRWLNAHQAELLPGGAALDVGCGLGDNSAELARRGFKVTAMDIAPSAIKAATERCGSIADFVVGDALALPVEWRGRFDLVVEIYTLQVLPPPERTTAARSIADTVAMGGTLLLIARARDDGDPTGSMPWPLTRTEIESLADERLKLLSIEDLIDHESPPVRRFVATFRVSGPSNTTPQRLGQQS